MNFGKISQEMSPNADARLGRFSAWIAGLLFLTRIAVASPGAPIITLSPTSLTFGQQAENTTSKAQTVKLTNSGNAALTITSITVSSGFVETSTCPSSLKAKQKCLISVTFSPTTAGNITGSLTINATTGVGTVSLSGVSTGIDAIQHIVFLVKENRSFNNYFGTFPGALGATSGPVSDGQTIPLGHTPDRVRDMGHSWKDALTAINGGKMNQFDLVQFGNINGDYMSMSQMYQTDIPNYWAYAQTFTLSDETFSSLKGGSFPNHLYTILADNAEVIGNPNEPGHPLFSSWGCDAVTGTTVELQSTTGVQSYVFPCFNNMTEGDLLNTAGISWKSYAPGASTAGYAWNTYDSIDHIRNSSVWSENVVPYTNFVTDAAAGNLPAVSWLVPDTADSDHGPASTCAGENWVVQQINAVMQGPDWPSTAIFLTWDDFGGFYDPAVPAAPDYYGFGPRVPMIIISPYSLAGQVVHTQYEFSSVLKFIETRFGLGNLTLRDLNAADMTDAFNFNQTPLPPLVLKTRTCPAGPILNIGNSKVDFGNVVVGQSSTLTRTITNIGTVALNIDNVAIGNPYYTQTNNCGSVLPAKASCTFSFVFTPTQDKTQDSTCTITDDATSSPQIFYLYGAGTSSAAEISKPKVPDMQSPKDGDDNQMIDDD